MMARMSQEFYCGECQNYFIVRLNMELNHEVLVVCPNKKCKHEHRRRIENGQIFESGRFSKEPAEHVLANVATLSKIPFTEQMQKAAEKNSYGGRRDGVPIIDPMRWHDIAARERGED
jgi:hypothetical protein